MRSATPAVCYTLQAAVRCIASCCSGPRRRGSSPRAQRCGPPTPPAPIAAAVQRRAQCNRRPGSLPQPGCRDMPPHETTRHAAPTCRAPHLRCGTGNRECRLTNLLRVVVPLGHLRRDLPGRAVAERESRRAESQRLLDPMETLVSSVSGGSSLAGFAIRCAWRGRLNSTRHDSAAEQRPLTNNPLLTYHPEVRGDVVDQVVVVPVEQRARFVPARWFE